MLRCCSGKAQRNSAPAHQCHSTAALTPTAASTDAVSTDGKLSVSTYGVDIRAAKESIIRSSFCGMLCRYRATDRSKLGDQTGPAHLRWNATEFLRRSREMLTCPSDCVKHNRPQGRSQGLQIDLSARYQLRQPAGWAALDDMHRLASRRRLSWCAVAACAVRTSPAQTRHDWFRKQFAYGALGAP